MFWRFWGKGLGIQSINQTIKKLLVEQPELHLVFKKVGPFDSQTDLQLHCTRKSHGNTFNRFDAATIIYSL